MEISVSLDPVSGEPELKNYLEELNEMSGIAIHLDVMDGVFVPRVSFPMDEYEYVIRNSVHPIDMHLMINNPDADLKMYADIAKQGRVRSICFHVEAQSAIVTEKLLKSLKDMDIMCGIAVDLPSKVSEMSLEVLSMCDVITIMSVKCGASGQSFNPEALEKVKAIHAINPTARIILDGGVSAENFDMVKRASVNTAVMGSAFYKATDRKGLVAALTG